MTGRSAAVKETLISSLVLDHYRGVFENIYIFSSTVHLDSTWQAITACAREELGQGKTNDPASVEFIFDKFEEIAIRNIINKQQDSLKRQTQEKTKRTRGSLIIFDDLPHDGEMKTHQAGINA